MNATRAHRRLTLIAAGSSIRVDGFARDVRKGLTDHPKQLSCRYFYDGDGSQLFEAICALPEYYLTRAEREILQAHAVELVSPFARPPALVELGSGSAAKTRLLIEAFLRRHQTLLYIPIDISRTMLEQSARQLLDDYRGLEIRAIAAEYREGLRQLPAAVAGPRLILWLGSNVGNLHRPEAVRFLDQVRTVMTVSDSLLVGIDLREESTFAS